MLSVFMFRKSSTDLYFCKLLNFVLFLIELFYSSPSDLVEVMVVPSLQGSASRSNQRWVMLCDSECFLACECVCVCVHAYVHACVHDVALILSPEFVYFFSLLLHLPPPTFSSLYPQRGIFDVSPLSGISGLPV